MRTEEVSPPIPIATNRSLSIHSHPSWRWLRFLRSPLWICLLLALLIRVWLQIRTGGVIAGDEAMVGIQAEHILQGERPIYYYAQPYMGSLEAYFAALLFAIFGASVWSFRAVSILLSVLLVFLTWRLAGALADAAHLPAHARRRFMVIAALVAALPPLYDTVIEMRVMGGYIEAFVIMAWLLLSGLRLTQRWKAGAPAHELALRWAGIGLLIGLGLWVNPLTVSAMLAAALWIGGYIILELVNLCQKSGSERRDALFSFLGSLSPIVTAVPAALVGCLPALYWGAGNNWQNIAYMLHNGPALSDSRLHTIVHVQLSYDTCTAPRVIGGALPTEPYVTNTNPHLLTFGLIVGVFCIAVSVSAIALSLYWRSSFIANICQLAGFPLLFGACTALIYAISNNTVLTLSVACGPLDIVGRYATPLLIALPFFIAAVFTAISTFGRKNRSGQSQGSSSEQLQERDERKSPARSLVHRLVTDWSFSKIVQVGLLVILVGYLGSQGYAYFTANAGYTFQASGCTQAPANNDPMISYILEHHIRYAWSHGWIADPITFKTESAVETGDPRFPASLSRIPAYNLAVRHADRPSIFTLVVHSDPNPPPLRLLAAHNITYSLARFYSEPGFDFLIITPLNRSVTVQEANALTTSFNHC